jgi:hypothetical protein
LKVTPTEVVAGAAAVYQACSTGWSRRRGTTSSGTPIIRSRLITVGSSTGCDRCAGYERTTQPQVIIAGHAFKQNLRRDHYELAVEAPPTTGRRCVYRTRPSDLIADLAWAQHVRRFHGSVKITV